MSYIEEKAKNILAVVLKLDSDEAITNASMNSISGWDSMLHLSIITGLENEFDIFIEASEAEKLTSYASIIDFLNNHPEID